MKSHGQTCFLYFGHNTLLFYVNVIFLKNGVIKTKYGNSRFRAQLGCYRAGLIITEVTFFPNDISKKDFKLDIFLNWLRPILFALETNEYFVGYDNASWKYGDTGNHSGVIFSNHQYDVFG